MGKWIKRHRVLVGGGAAVLVVAAVIAFFWFEPHKLLFDDRVDEALPTAPAAAPEPATTVATSPSVTVRRRSAAALIRSSDRDTMTVRLPCCSSSLAMA